MLISTMLIALGGLAVPGAHPVPVYDIVLSRTYRVGDRLFLDATGSSRRSSDLPGRKTPKVETQSLILSGTLEVLAVRATGQVERSRFTVKHFEGKVDGNPVSGIVAGDILLITVKEGKTIYTRGGTPLKGALEELLKLVIQYKDDDGPGDQAYFGSETPQPVGGTWPVNAEMAAAALSQEKMTVEARDVTGLSRLVGVTLEDDVPCLQVSGTMKVENVEVALPRMAKLTSSFFSIEMEGLFPVDPTLPPKRLKTTVGLDMRFKGTGLLAAFRFGIRETRTSEQALRIIARGPAPHNEVDAGKEPVPTAGKPHALPDGETSGWRVLRSE